MKATIEGGLLDKILKTPEGGELRISHGECDGILSNCQLATVGGGMEILKSLSDGKPTLLLGRILIVDDSIGR